MKDRNGRITPTGLLEAGFKLEELGIGKSVLIYAFGGRLIRVVTKSGGAAVTLRGLGCNDCDHVAYAATMSQVRMLKSVWLGVVKPTPRTEGTYDE